MKTESYLFHPEPGQIIQIYVRHSRFDFLHGYCRAVLHAGRHMMFVRGFRRRTDPGMSVVWSEPCDFGIQPFGRYSLEFTPEAQWMSLNKPPQLFL
jgi:hypothetical protein